MNVYIKKKDCKTLSFSPEKFLKLFILILLLKEVFTGNLTAREPDNDSFVRQDLKFQHITVADGLPQNTVKRIIQDHLGFLWITTQNGLVKYDGYTFTTYMYEFGDPDLIRGGAHKSLSDRNLTEILEDHLGNIWVGTMSGGLNKFNRETEIFTHYRHQPEDPTSLSHDGAYTLYEDKNGVLWIGTRDGLNKFNRETEVFISYRHDPHNPNTLSNNEIYALLEDRPGNFWVGTRNGLNRFDRQTGKVKRYLYDPNDQGSLIATIYEDKSGRLWIGTSGGGLIRFDDETETFLHYQYEAENPYSITHNSVYSILEDHRGNFWVGTYGGGLNKFDRQTGRFYHYQNSPNNPNSISGNFIRFIFEDRSGVLWIGTWLNGLNKLDAFSSKFTHYQHNPRDNNSLNNNRVWALEVDGERNLWIGTDGGGLNKLDRKTGRFSAYVHDPDNPYSLSNNKVGIVYEDPSGTLWVGTYGGGLNRFDRKNERFFRYMHNPNDSNSLSSNGVQSILRDSKGLLWVGTWNGGLNKFELEKGIFTHYLPDESEPGSISSSRVNSIFEDSFGTLWIGTDGRGLNKYNHDSDNFTQFYDPEKGFAIILNIYEDSRGRFWIGTYNAGLHLFDRSTGTTVVFTEKDGLPHNSIKGILEDAAGNLWLSTERGVSKFNYENRSFRNYDVADGLQGSHFHDHAADKGADGMLFFGGNNGFNSFYPDRLEENRFPPQVVLTHFKIFNQSVPAGENSPLKKHINVAREIILPYWQNDISIGYAALHFSCPEKNSYAYKMENYESEWRQVGQQRSATYTNLDPGVYVFRVKAANGDGVWNDEGTSISIVINPAFWETWWFRALLTILVISLALTGYRRKLKNARMKTELQAAHDAQMSIMPQTDPQIEGIGISGVCIPANEVGGDFFDYIWLDKAKTRLGIVVGDVSGKAMSAAMMAVMTSGMVNSEAHNSKSVKDILTRINRPLYSKTDKQTFVALCFASINIHTKELTFTNAGLNEPLLKSNGGVTYLKGEGPRYPLGGIEDSIYQEKKVQLKSGDVLVLSTDGIPDAQNHAKQFYGYDTLQILLQKMDTNQLSAKTIMEEVIKSVKRFSGTAKQYYDDMTIVVIKIT